MEEFPIKFEDDLTLGLGGIGFGFLAYSRRVVTFVVNQQASWVAMVKGFLTRITEYNPYIWCNIE
jgi:hypothetical protein